MRSLCDLRLRVLACVLAAIALAGAAIAWLPQPHREEPGSKTYREAEIHRRFMQGAAMLHAKRYDFAVAAFDRVLVLEPGMPEAHVNMGYALLGLGRHADARGFFERAVALRARQVNAYFGLAVALEGLNDIAGAVGAMRTYMHLSPPTDPYLRKAEAALWEWENALERERGGPR